ncbi:MAG: DUF502 domain-containing protein [Steroidobacteraceae bacterium]
MRRIWTTFIAGLATVLPVTITLYLIFWLGSTAETVLGDALQLVINEEYYRPGMGLLAGFLVVLVVGSLVNAYVVRWFIRKGEAWLERIPLVKTVYGSVKDITKFLPGQGERRDSRRVVLWMKDNVYTIGFVTADHVNKKLPQDVLTNRLPVYFPMSYQIGGYTLYILKSDLIETDLSAEEAMRLVLIGGVNADASNNLQRGADKH